MVWFAFIVWVATFGLAIAGLKKGGFIGSVSLGWLVGWGLLLLVSSAQYSWKGFTKDDEVGTSITCEGSHGREQSSAGWVESKKWGNVGRSNYLDVRCIDHNLNIVCYFGDQMVCLPFSR